MKVKKLYCLGIITAALVASAALAQGQTRVGLHSSSGSCSNCDLSGKDLPGMILRDANFKGSVFNRANLSGGKIYNSDLSDTHFRKSFLVKVDGLHVNFAKSKMQDVTLVESRFEKSIFADADLRRGDLARGRFEFSTFKNANLSSVSAPGSSFKGSKFYGANFDHANLQEAVLDQAILKNVEFGRALLRGASFKGANLSGANLSDVLGLSQVQLDDACGDPDTQLPSDFNVSYCTETQIVAYRNQHIHSKPKKHPEYAAKRLDRAVESLEHLMSDGMSGREDMQKKLEKIHSDLVSVQREMEK